MDEMKNGASSLPNSPSSPFLRLSTCTVSTRAIFSSFSISDGILKKLLFAFDVWKFKEGSSLQRDYVRNIILYLVKNWYLAGDHNEAVVKNNETWWRTNRGCKNSIADNTKSITLVRSDSSKTDPPSVNGHQRVPSSSMISTNQQQSTRARLLRTCCHFAHSVQLTIQLSPLCVCFRNSPAALEQMSVPRIMKTLSCGWCITSVHMCTQLRTKKERKKKERRRNIEAGRGIDTREAIKLNRDYLFIDIFRFDLFYPRLIKQ